EACIYACRTISERVVTAELSLRYRRPVPVGEEVTLQARVTQRNRRTMSATAELTIDGTVHATAKTKVFVLR
ncbi:MAG: PaaI family thioesterase, partial [Desulfuromonadales bacterium]|nr:PaaI family thioesterase [Desulfuromonadales bacterium]NIR33363.1 PaaI family thioesterase [Desulfuromonadales bacterium]NIS39562.1 PaaI family thioesterase [Desulfuromonadales bacterium]